MKWQQVHRVLIIQGSPTKMQFKAETRRLLDIVANSLYSDKEVFVRELISNAADALEKLRYLQNTSKEVLEMDGNLCIKLFVDKEKKLFVLQDSGVGMTREELEENLGTIALSGSKKFLEKMDTGSATKDKIIGQFGVGFYSSFMVGHKVEVFSKSAIQGSQGYHWISDGLGEYSINTAENVAVGTKIIIHLKEEDLKFAESTLIESIIKKYSNFVGFPVYLNGKQINTVQALWTMEKSQVSLEQYADFYKFVSNDFMEPRSFLHYSTDAPINLRALLFISHSNAESFGLQRMQQNISLYSRKVLIKGKTDQLLPGWMRFIVGIVDSEDIPLNLSRELLQNNLLVSKIKRVLTGRVIKWLDEMGRNDNEKYISFYKEFSAMIKEGLCTDQDFKGEIAKLLRFEYSGEEGKMISVQEYISMMKEDQKDIVYLQAPSRQMALASPYYEPFKNKGIPVLFMYETIDEFVCEHMSNFQGKNVVSAEKAGESMVDETPTEQKLQSEASESLISWLTGVFGNTVSSIKVSSRMTSQPAIVVDHESESYMKLMKMYNRQLDLGMPPQKLEINTAHPIIKGLAVMKDKDEEMAKTVAQLVLDNACINAGLIEDARPIVSKINVVLERALKQ